MSAAEMSGRLFRSLAVAALAAVSLSAGAQGTFPEHPIRVIINVAPGGPSDVLGRLFATKLSEAFNGKPVIVENKPGAGGNIGIDTVAKSKPDGYTLLLLSYNTMAINTVMSDKQLPFDAVRDLAGVGRVVSSQLALVAHPSFPPNNIGELVAYAKARPANSIAFGSPGNGSLQHIGGEMINTKAGIKLTHVAYKGATGALQDLLGGQIPLASVGLPSVVENLKSGKLKAIAVFGGTRSSLAPDVPTFVESGYPEIEMELDYGIFAAKATPRPIIDRLNLELVKMLKAPDVREKLIAAGFVVGPSMPAELDARLKAAIEKWRPIVRESGAKAD